MELWVFVVFAALYVEQARSAISQIESREWEQYKETYGKAYDSPKVEGVRRKIFLSHRKKIAAHNERFRRGEESFTVSLNGFSDTFSHEISRRSNGFQNNRSVESVNVFVPRATALPESVDWRELRAVTPVKNQGKCGGCWAFSAAGSIEGQRARASGESISLSVQNLIDCSRPSNHGCDGGTMNRAFQYAVDNELNNEHDYPFEDAAGTCRYNASNEGAKISSFVSLRTGDETNLARAVAEIGPVAAAIDAAHWSFHHYSGGVFNEHACRSNASSHGVLVVGYGKENGKSFWLVKNSFGTDWGVNGYVKMSKDAGNHCGIANAASYPVL